MDVAFRLTTPLEALPQSVMVSGKIVPVRLHNETLLIADLPKGVTSDQLSNMLQLMLGVQASEVEHKPGQFKVEPHDFSREMDRLLEEQEREAELLKQILEPHIEINTDDPPLEAMVPVGRSVWDSIFIKFSPVVNLQQWLQTTEADECVYLPNDSSRPPSEAEEVISNAFYTEVMVNAYVMLCKRKHLKPKVRLVNGQVLDVISLSPMCGSQHTVPGEVSARLANSHLLDLDDSVYAKDFIQCVCDLEPSQYEKEPIRRRVLAKVEHILMGRTSHTYNQRFIHALYNKFVNDSGDVPWAAYRVPMANCVMGILKQMVVEGRVLEDSRELFLSRLQTMGFGEYSDAVGAVFDSSRLPH